MLTHTPALIHPGPAKAAAGAGGFGRRPGGSIGGDETLAGEYAVENMKGQHHSQNPELIDIIL